MDTLAALHDLDPSRWAALALLVLSLALVVPEPWLGRRAHAALVADLDAAEPHASAQDAARVRHYRRWVRLGWTSAVATLALVVALPGAGLGSLGLRAPDLTGLVGGGDSRAAGFVVGGLVGIALATALVVAVGRWLGRPLVAVDTTKVAPMLPATSRGRRWWAAVSVTAGVTEEVVYRGLVVLTLAVLLPDAGRSVVAVVAAVCFGLAHWYQGRLGVLGTAVLGWTFTQLYLSTGSLLVPMVLHALIDLRVLVLDSHGAIRAAGARSVAPAAGR